MNLDDLFPTKEEQISASESLKALVHSNGWKVLTKIIDKDLEKYDNQLKFTDFNNIEEQRAVQKRYADLLLLKEYPGQIVRELTDDNVPELELDPYSSSDEE